MKKKFLLVSLAAISAFAFAFALAGCNNEQGETACKHEQMQHTSASNSNCITHGTDEYWYCPDCTTYFTDAGGTTKTTLEAVTKPLGAHNYTYESNGPEGHSGTCSLNSEHKVTNEAHDTSGEGGACSKCGILKITKTKVAEEDQPSSGTRYSFVAVKTGFYEVWGETSFIIPSPLPIVDVSVGTLNTDKTLNALATHVQLYLTKDTTYYADASTDDPFDVVLAEEHEHTFETGWTNNYAGHWHAATCNHTDEISDYAAHTFSEWSEPDGEGKLYRSCSVCHYQEEKLQATELDDTTLEIAPTTDTDYTVQIVAVVDDSGFSDSGWIVETKTFTLRNDSDTAKTYTFTCMNAITYLEVEGGEPAYAYEEGATIVVELAGGVTLQFGVSTNEEVLNASYSKQAAFSITVADVTATGGDDDITIID